jgi:hypothetical protein
MNREFNWLKINRRLKVFYFHEFIKALLSYPQFYKQVQGITLRRMIEAKMELLKF